MSLANGTSTRALSSTSVRELNRLRQELTFVHFCADLSISCSVPYSTGEQYEGAAHLISLLVKRAIEDRRDYVAELIHNGNTEEAARILPILHVWTMLFFTPESKVCECQRVGYVGTGILTHGSACLAVYIPRVEATAHSPRAISGEVSGYGSDHLPALSTGGTTYS